MTEKVSLVIFDMDGLMFDTERIGIRAWMQAGRDFGIPVTPEIVIETIGTNIRVTEQIFRKHLGDIPFEEMKKKRFEHAFEEFEHACRSDTDVVSPVKKGLPELLDWLHEQNIRRCVATSTERERARQFMKMAGVLDRFDEIVCGNEVAHSKPEPDIFLEAARRMGVSPSECVVLEDSEHGLTAAHRAGMKPVLVVDIKRPAPEVEALAIAELESLAEAPALIAGLAGC